jgi:hypothetical protein
MTDNNKNKIIPVSLESLSVESPAGICSTSNIIPVTKKSLVINDTQCHKTTPMHSSALVNKNLNIYNSIEPTKPKQAAQKISIPTRIDTITSIDPASNTDNGVYQSQPSNLTPVTPNPVKRVEKCDGTDTFVISTEKDVYVNTYETVYEQKFIENTNITGSVIQVGEITGSCYSNKVSCANALGFDTDSGFEVTDFGGGIAKIAMNSTFKCWNVDGNPGLIACGLDTVNFVAGCNISITSCNTAVPKTLTISASGGSPVAQATPTTLGTTYASNQTSYCNTFVGYCAGNTTTTGKNNIGIGVNSLQNIVGDAFNYGNVGIGTNTLRNTTTGYGNIAIGTGVLETNTTGFDNVAIGSYNLYCNTYGCYNLAIGSYSLYANTWGAGNIGIGLSTLNANTTGYGNIAVGCRSLSGTTTGSYNLAVGYGAMRYAYGGYGNIALGAGTLNNNISGQNNIAIGNGALCCNTTGNNNIILGTNAGNSISTGSDNTIIGNLTGSAGLVCTLLIGAGTCERVKVDNTGLYINGTAFSGGGSQATPTALGTVYACTETGLCANTTLGHCAGSSTGCYSVTIGNCSGALCGDTYSVAIGSCAGVGGSNCGWANVAIGYCAGKKIDAANVVIGYGAGNSCNVDAYNVAIGYGSMGCGTTVCIGLCNLNGLDFNTAVGSCSMKCMSGCSNFNLALGNNSLMYGRNLSFNIAIGTYGLNQSSCSYGNVAIGRMAMYGNSACVAANCSTGCNNVGLGSRALYRIAGGSCNIAIGRESGYCVTLGNNNILIGCKSGCTLSTESNNTIIGSLQGIVGLSCTVLIGAGSCERIKVDNNGLCINGSVYSPSLNSYCSFKVGNGLASSTGYNNIAIGCNSLVSNTTGSNNIALGSGALFSQTANSYGYGNIALGKDAMRNNLIGYGNIAIGDCALYSYCAPYGGSIAIGHCSLKNNIDGINIGIGYGSLECSTSGTNNVAIGYSTMNLNTIGRSNVAVGGNALRYNVTGCYNVAVGANSLQNNLGNYNIAIGGASMSASSTGNSNIAIGAVTLLLNSGGSNNVAIGDYSLNANSYGNNNVVIGCSSLYCNTTGCHNIAIGINTLFNNAGGHNTAIGGCAGHDLTNGCNNVLIGWCAQAQTVTSCNTITLGNSAITCIRSQVTTISALSDARDKTDVEELQLGLQFILDLRPVKFTWNMRDGAKVGVEDSGFIAQEVAALEDSNGVTQWLDMVGRENPEKLEVKPGKLIPILVKAIQDLNNKFTSEISRLEQEILSLKSSIQ